MLGERQEDGIMYHDAAESVLVDLRTSFLSRVDYDKVNLRFHTEVASGSKIRTPTFTPMHSRIVMFRTAKRMRYGCEPDPVASQRPLFFGPSW